MNNPPPPLSLPPEQESDIIISSREGIYAEKGKGGGGFCKVSVLLKGRFWGDKKIIIKTKKKTQKSAKHLTGHRRAH